MDPYPFHLAPPDAPVTDARLIDALVPILDGIWSQISLITQACRHHNLNGQALHDALTLVGGNLAQATDIFNLWKNERHPEKSA
jgi:hypothetical protein